MNDRLFRWQAITLVTLWIGYAGYYVCRSNLSVAGPLLEKHLAAQPVGPTEQWLDAIGARVFGSMRAASDGLGSLFGIGAPDEAGDADDAAEAGESASTTADESPRVAPNDAPQETAAEAPPPDGLGKRRFGMFGSVGLLLYAAGKFFSGILCDFVGGRRMFLLGMAGSVACTVAFGLSTGFAALLTFWALNRLVQSTGWSGLVEVASRWFPAHRHGSILGVLTLSYLFGDALARLGLGLLLSLGLGWRGLFLSAAGLLAAIAVASRFVLKSSPADVGAPEPEANPENVYGPRGNAPRPSDLVDLLWPLAASLSFWLVCVMSFGLTLVRETFNYWNPIYLKEVGGLSDAGAAAASALFPLVGGLSTIAAGLLSDRLVRGRRGAIMLPFLAVLVAALWGLSRLEPGSGYGVPLALTSLVSFAMLGPYSFLTGVLSLDFGGKRGSSTAAGLADTAGYLGGVVSGVGVGAIAATRGWTGVFGALSVAAVATLAAAALYWYLHDVLRRPKGERIA